jgi:Meckel syndrome type 1 protein
LTTIASLLLTTAPGAMLPGAASPAPGVASATGDFLKLVLPGCGDGVAAGVVPATGEAGRQNLAGVGTGLPLVDIVVPSGEAALAWLADATGVAVPPPPPALPAETAIPTSPAATTSGATTTAALELPESPPLVRPRLRVVTPDVPVRVPGDDHVEPLDDAGAEASTASGKEDDPVAEPVVTAETSVAVPIVAPTHDVAPVSAPAAVRTEAPRTEEATPAVIAPASAPVRDPIEAATDQRAPAPAHRV